METQQMAMPAEMAAQGPNPEEMAIYDQMRQQISPQEFSNEMLAGASQVDPQAVAEFTEELQSLDVSPEELDALNDLVDQILANPEQYDQLRQQYLAQGMPDDILPEQFDPYFFAALNMAVDQMIAAPTGVQAFAKGGIAELKPIAKAIASYGRNGDTMLAHITPAEARMLKRRGGSGTINPATGLPEFFLKKAFKSIGKAVKKFASSTVGRLVTTVALGFFLGPAAASMVGATSAAGVAAVSGFVGGAGSTLLAGGNLKDALKAGAIGGIVAGAGTGLMGGADSFASGSASTAGLTPGQALQSRVDQFTGMFKPGAAVQAPVPQEGATPASLGPNQAPTPDAGSAAYDLNMQAQQAARTGSTFDPRNALTDNVTTGAQRDAYMAGQGLDKGTSLVDQTKQFYKENISPSGIREAATPGAQQAAANAVAAAEKTIPANITGAARDALLKTAYDNALKGAMPGILGTYGPMAGVGLGIMGLTGGFESKSGPGITPEDRKGPTERIREEGSQKQYFVQGLPGVKYDQFGEPVYGESMPFTTRDPYFSDSLNFALPSTIGGIQGVAPPMAVYNTPSGSFGSRQVAQPYNNANMYSNLMAPQRYADGGQVQYFDNGGDATAKTPEQIAAEEAAAAKAAADAAALRETQRLAREEVARQKQMRRAAGSGAMYANINAGISALAPENFPGAPVQLAADREAAMRTDFSGQKSDIEYARLMQEKGYRPEEVAALTGRTFGDINRRFNTALRQDAYAPMLQGQRDAMAEQARILRGMPGTGSPVQPPVTQPPVDTGGPIAITPVTPPVIQPPVTQPPVTKPAVTNTQITDFLASNPNLTDRQIRDAMDQFGVGVDQMANVTGIPAEQIQQRYDTPSNFSNQAIQDYLGANPNMTDAQIRGAMDQFGVGTAQMAAATGLPLDQIQQRYNTAGATVQPSVGAEGGISIQGGLDEYGNLYGSEPYHYGRGPKPGSTASVQPPSSITDQDILGFLSANPGMTDIQIRGAMDQYGVDPARMASATGMPLEQIQQRYNAAAAPTAFMNMGGIATLAQGGYPRRTGQISGPGTEKSDSIPAMLSDGEFVMTAKAVRGAGKGNRRAGAKQMYKLMHQLEKNSERG